MRFPRLLAIAALASLTCLAFGTSLLALPQDAPGSTTVYVTRTGAKYHRGGLQFTVQERHPDASR